MIAFDFRRKIAFLLFFFLLVAEGRDKRFTGEFEYPVAEQYPWIAQHVTEDSRPCNAVLISPDYLLTSGHCFDGFDLDCLAYEFRNLQPAIMVPAEKVLIHSQKALIACDLALVKLARPVHLDKMPVIDTQLYQCGQLPHSREVKSAGYKEQGELKRVSLSWFKRCWHKRYQPGELWFRFKGKAERGNSGSPLFYNEHEDQAVLFGIACATQSVNEKRQFLKYTALAHHLLSFIEPNTDLVFEVGGDEQRTLIFPSGVCPPHQGDWQLVQCMKPFEESSVTELVSTEFYFRQELGSVSAVPTSLGGVADLYSITPMVLLQKTLQSDITDQPMASGGGHYNSVPAYMMLCFVLLGL